MTVVQFGSAHVRRMMGEPTLYDKVPFLLPVKASGLRLLSQLHNARCTSCTKRALEPYLRSLDGAVTRLIVDESKRCPGSLAVLKVEMARILNSPVDEVRVLYTENGQQVELVF
jgi:hypothetical protein